MNYFVHSEALCETTKIGRNTRIWAFAHLLPEAVIGEDCNICDHVFIENDVVIGNRVTVKCGVQLWDGIRAEDDVFIGPNVTFTNDPFPRSKQRPAEFEYIYLRRGCSIGANATVLPSVTIGQYAMVGAGAVVTKSVPPNAIVRGNPARIEGYCTSLGRPSDGAVVRPSQPAPTGNLSVSGVSLHSIPAFSDLRGDLIAAEIPKHLPFLPVRFFVVHNVPGTEVRGEHAHRECHQLLISIRGSVHIVVDDGTNRQEVVLDRPELALHIPPRVWGTQYKYSADAALLVFASHPYDPADYIRDYGDWLRFVKDTA